MVTRTYFDKNNTIVYNSNVNTAMNPITELYYGSSDSTQGYTRFLFKIDETNLKDLHTSGTYPDLNKITHTLKMTNTGAFDTELLGKTTCSGKDRACSFDLILFAIDQAWDEGCGYDYKDCNVIGEVSQSFSPSNWIDAQTNTPWTGGSGTFTGSTTVLATQHFDKGNENLEIDVTDIVNDYLTGGTNNGLGIAFKRTLEETETTKHQYVGFFTRHTQTFYEPFIETTYSEKIKDDRHAFYLDKPNKLYLYVNLGGEPNNLDTIPSVMINDMDGNIVSSISTSGVTHVTKGVYSVDVTIPTTSVYTDCTQFSDVWSGITINGITRPSIELDVIVKDSMGYYNIGDNSALPKKVGLNVTGIKRDEKINRGDIRKVLVSTRIPYTVNQKQLVDSLKYRLYVKEGRNEYTVIDFQDVEMTNNNNYFLIDTGSLIPGIYYLDVKVESNLEVSTNKEVLKFEIVSQSDLRISQ